MFALHQEGSAQTVLWLAGGNVPGSSISGLQPSLLMSHVSHVHDNDPEVLGRISRDDAMSKLYRQIIEKEMKREKKHEDTHMKHAPGWSEVMASVSEANVKVCFFFQKINRRPSRYPDIQADQHEGRIDVKETIEFIRKKHDGYEKVTTVKETETGARCAYSPPTA